VETTFQLLPKDRRADDQPIVLLTPTQPLAANTVYELWDRRTIPCDDRNSGCALGAPASFSSFTTGDFTDSLPPAFAGIGQVAGHDPPFSTCANSACCGPYVVRSYDVSWEAARDQGDSWVRYNVYRQVGAVDQHVAVTEYTSSYLQFLCEGTTGRLVVKPGVFTVRAVDWAGNEERNGVTHTISDPCEGAPSVRPIIAGSGGATGNQGGSAAAGSGGATADATSPEAATPGATGPAPRGCEIASDAQGPGVPLAPLGLLAWLFRRRSGAAKHRRTR